VRDVIDAEDEDEEGEDLFGPGIDEYGFSVTIGKRALFTILFTVTTGEMSSSTRTPTLA
jgi:hypothetical protein